MILYSFTVGANVKIAMSHSFTSLDPRDQQSYQQFMITQSIYQSLFEIDEFAKISSEILENWKFDGKNLKLKIKKGVMFTNGSFLSSSDIQFSLSRHFDSKSKSIVKDYLECLESVKVKDGVLISVVILDEQNLVIKLKRYDPTIMFILSMPAFAIISSVAEKQGQLVGTGPMIPSFENNKLFLKNKDLAPGQGKIIEISNLKSLSSEQVEVQDLILTSNLVEDQEAMLKGHVKDKMESLSFLHFYGNRTSRLLENKRIRLQLRLAVQDASKEISKDSIYLKSANRFIPRKIMAKEYYNESNDNQLNRDNVDFREKIRIPMLKGQFSEHQIELFRIEFAKKGLKNIEIRSYDLGDFVNVFKKGEFDLLPIIYMANFPHVTGFTHLICSNFMGTKFLQANDFCKGVSNINQMQSSEELHKEYLFLLNEMESENYIFPAFETSLPLYRKSNVEFDSSFHRYESGLWKILKK